MISWIPQKQWELACQPMTRYYNSPDHHTSIDCGNDKNNDMIDAHKRDMKMYACVRMYGMYVYDAILFGSPCNV
jgi:hypothetical protein